MGTLRGLLPLLFLLSGLCGCSEDESTSPSQKATAATSASVVKIEAQTITEEQQWSGTIRALDEIVVRSPIDGKVRSRGVRIGDKVESGADLFSVEKPGSKKVHSALRERYETLNAEVQRWERLLEQGAAGPAELEQARLRLLDAKIALAGVDPALMGRQITSPTKGTVMELPAMEGTYVESGQALLTIADDNSVGASFLIPVSDAARLHDVDNLSIKTLAGEISVSHTYLLPTEDHAILRAHIRLQTTPADLTLPAMAHVVWRQDRQALIVPWSSVAADGDLTWVAALQGDPPKVKRIPVTLGGGLDLGLEVLEGLEPGISIIFHEPRNFPPGTVIKPRVRR